MKDITDLRARLFQALDDLADKKASPETIARAKALSDVAQTIINSAKVEVGYIRVSEDKGGIGFLGGGATSPALPVPAPANEIVEQGKGYTIRQHRLK